MDMSKLPKLSQTPQTPPAPETPEALAGKPEYDSLDYERRGGGGEPISLAEIWISIAVGAILLMLYPTMMKYVSSRLFGSEFLPFKLDDGTVVPYRKVYPQFWNDLSITLFALTLIVEGITLAMIRNRFVVTFAFGLTVLATAMNLWYVLATFSTYGPPIISLLAVAFGGYIAAYQWRLLKSVRRRAKRAS